VAAPVAVHGPSAQALKLGAVLGWADLNLVVILKLSILRSFKLGRGRIIRGARWLL